MIDNKLARNKTQTTAIYEAVKTNFKAEIAVEAVKKVFQFTKRKALSN